MSDTIRVERREGYRVIAINRADRMNALDRDSVVGLTDALAQAEADETCRAVILTGTGRAFCAGADLSVGAGIVGGKRDVRRSIEETWNPLARRLSSLRMPSIAAVNGVAAGAGANVALGCDFVLAARSARFIQAFAKIGLIPDCGGTFHLPRLIGEARARAIAMLAEPVDAERAEAWGMIWRAIDDSALMAEAEKLAAHLAVQPTHGLVLTRRALRASAQNSFDQQLDLERDLQQEASLAPDYSEGVKAFLEKRPPVFTGRRA
jgi:2-(1,2-epoxy-1,2-dihydrophenyl)acetyl-CoA isomerase